jgi:5'-3' exoribonuclease 1
VFVTKYYELPDTALFIMGVHRLQWYMNQYHGACMTPTNMADAYIGTTDVLCVDVNTLIYPAVQAALEANPQAQWTEVVDAVLAKILGVVEWVSPRHGVYLAIDGVAGNAKQAQQRKRRFKARADAQQKAGAGGTDTGFDTTAITCGTPFMAYFQHRLKDAVATIWPASGALKAGLHVWVSDDAIPGEGEHKLVRFVDGYAQMPGRRSLHYTLMSIDADVLFLALGLMLPNTTVLKFNSFSKDPGNYNLVDIAKWGDLIVSEWKAAGLTRDETLRDFIGAACLFGNDFIPGVEVAHLGFGGWDSLNLAYLQVVGAGGKPLVAAAPLHGDGGDDEGVRSPKRRRTSAGPPKYSLDRAVARAVAAVLSQSEQTVLSHRAHSARLRTHPDHLLRKYCPQAMGKIDFGAYRIAFYARNMEPGPESTDELARRVAASYWDGVDYTIQYYLVGIPDWSWSYPYHYAPLCLDLAEGDADAKVEEGEIVPRPFDSSSRPVHRHLALLSIMPKESLHAWAPFKTGPFIDSVGGDAAKWFDATQVRTDLDGKINDYEAVVILPDVDMKSLRAHVQQHVVDEVGGWGRVGVGDEDDAAMFRAWTEKRPARAAQCLAGLMENMVDAGHGTLFHLSLNAE